MMHMKSCNHSELRFSMPIILFHRIKYTRQMPSLIQVFSEGRKKKLFLFNGRTIKALPPLLLSELSGRMHIFKLRASNLGLLTDWVTHSSVRSNNALKNLAKLEKS